MDNLKQATRHFFDSVSGGVFPEIECWECVEDEDEGITELVQVDKAAMNDQAVIVHLEFYSKYIAALIFNADKSVDTIINRLFYSFCGYGVETFIEVATMPNIHTSQRIPTSDTKKEIMEKEIKELEESISLLSNESAKIERILSLKRGVKMYEQFKINTQKKHLI